MRPPSTAPESTADQWRAALWLLEALPPSRRAGADDASPLRRRKIAATLAIVANFHNDANRPLQEEVVPGAPFVYALMRWLENRGVEDQALRHLDFMQNHSFRMLLAVAGSPRAAHAILLAFCRARVAVPDTAFREGEIRAATLRGLLAR